MNIGYDLEEAEECLSTLLQEFYESSDTRLGYSDFCSKCLERLKKEEFGLDYKNLEICLRAKDISIFDPKRIKVCRKRERFCFRKIQAMYDSYIHFRYTPTI